MKDFQQKTTLGQNITGTKYDRDKPQKEGVNKIEWDIQ